jgi:hypothetical protein
VYTPSVSETECMAIFGTRSTTVTDVNNAELLQTAMEQLIQYAMKPLSNSAIQRLKELTIKCLI